MRSGDCCILTSFISHCQKSKYADSVVEGDTRIGHVMDKIRALGLDKVLSRAATYQRLLNSSSTAQPTFLPRDLS
jgi:hypothetical protein